MTAVLDAAHFEEPLAQWKPRQRYAKATRGSCDCEMNGIDREVPVGSDLKSRAGQLFIPVEADGPDMNEGCVIPSDPLRA